jgi:hypothetical protein
MRPSIAIPAKSTEDRRPKPESSELLHFDTDVDGTIVL